MTEKEQEKKIEEFFSAMEKAESSENKEEIEKRLKSVSFNWYKNLKGVKFSDWTNELIKYTFPIYEIKIPNRFFKNAFVNEWNGDMKKADKHIKKLIKVITKELLPLKYLSQIFNKDIGYFVKLESRSPKDSPFAYDYKLRRTNPIRNAEEIVAALMSSMRTFEDVIMLLRIKKQIILHIRPFYLIPKRCEWRVFVKNKKIVGISQQFYDEFFDYDREYISTAEGRIRDFIDNIVKYNVHAKSFVADIILYNTREPIKLVSGINSFCQIIETNPYGLSDPCLFKDYKELETTQDNFRYRIE